jgi:DNA-binding MarR family transcriptional regulator
LVYDPECGKCPRLEDSALRLPPGISVATVTRTQGGAVQECFVRDRMRNSALTRGGSLGASVRALHHAHVRRLDFEKAYGLTAVQFSVLAALVDRPGSDQNSVSQATFLDKSTLTAVTGRLVARRLVTARRNKEDLRRAELIPTRTAIALMYDATPQLVQRDEDFLSALEPGRREPFLELFRVVAYAEREGHPGSYRVPSPDGLRPPLVVSWGLGHTFRSTMQRHHKAWTAAVPDVTFVQWLALRALADRPGLDQSSVAELAKVDKATASVLLVRLCEKGLLNRQRSSTDQRRYVLDVTDEGRHVVERTAAGAQAVESLMTETLSARERSQFMAGIEVLFTAYVD